MNLKAVRDAYYGADVEHEKFTEVLRLADDLDERIKGKRGAPEKRERFYRQAVHYFRFVYPSPQGAIIPRWKRKALGLADMAGQYYDEHGYKRGDYHSTAPLDYVAPAETKTAPYHDYGGAGLALVEVHRTRVYARSYAYGPGRASTRYLVGRNEAGTFFAHPVPKTVSTVAEACQWIWSGKANSIIARQGDIALVRGAGPKIPAAGLPEGHEIVEGSIVHDTHPPIRYPGKGERIIVGRRAHVVVSEATRD